MGHYFHMKNEIESDYQDNHKCVDMRAVDVRGQLYIKFTLDNIKAAIIPVKNDIVEYINFKDEFVELIRDIKDFVYSSNIKDEQRNRAGRV